MNDNLQVNLHDLNKNIIAQMPELSRKEVKGKKNEVKKWVESQPNANYFMLLSNEKRDYTVFKIGVSLDVFILEFFELLNSRGKVKAIDFTGSAFEIWIDDAFYAFFNYDAGVIETK